MDNLMFIILTILNTYFLFAVSDICRGKAKNAVFFACLLIMGGIGFVIGIPETACLGNAVISLVFVYFYTEGLFGRIWYLIGGVYLYLLAVLLLFRAGQSEYLAAYISGELLLLFLLLSKRRNSLRVFQAIFVSGIYGSIMLSEWALLTWGPQAVTKYAYMKAAQAILLSLAVFLFLLLEVTVRVYAAGYQTSVKAIQKELMQQQYEEIKAVYLNMRGWRHDYHNHIQVLKANLAAGQILAAGEYLNRIEEELSHVEAYIKSGNIMADAILNSKLTLAEERKVQVVCDAYLPEHLFIPDIDLCILLGNILDNALESCDKQEVSKRFIRIYIAQAKEQLYLSIQNASMEVIDMHQKLYISKKRGNHGLGLKRVEAVVEKWNGFLNISQEAGIFAVEVILPKP